METIGKIQDHSGHDLQCPFRWCQGLCQSPAEAVVIQNAPEEDLSGEVISQLYWKLYHPQKT